MKAGVCAGLMQSGADVVDLGVVPTPALQLYVRNHPELAGGVMVTASHCARRYNGLKVFSQGGIEFAREDEQALRSFYEREIDGEDMYGAGVSRFDGSAAEDYVEAVVSCVDVGAVRSAGLKVCADCAGGAAALTTPLILKRLGVEAIVVGADMLGEPSRESDPSAENLADFSSLAVSVGADLAVAHDIDGSRAVFLDEEGARLGGDAAGAIVAKAVLSGEKGRVVTPATSSEVLERTVASEGGAVRYTPTGSHEVVHRMLESKAVFGAEEDGGMYFTDLLVCRDGGLALAKMLEVVAKGGSLSRQAFGLSEYYTFKISVPCPRGSKAAVMERFAEGAKAMRLRVDSTDGLKALTDDGWVLMRPAEAEDAVRIYSEATSAESARERAEKTAERVRAYLGEAAQAGKRPPGSFPEALGVDRQDLVYHPGGEYRGDPGRVRRRAHLVDVEADQPVADHVYGALHVHRREAEGLRGAGPGRVRRVDAVDVQGEVDLLRLHRVQRLLHGPGHPHVEDVVGADEPHRVVPLQLLGADGPGAQHEDVV